MGTGLDLARDFYRHRVAPLLGGVPHAAALLGPGSEVLGFDDVVSQDHDFGPRVQIFAGALPGVGLPAGAEVDTVAGFFTARLGTDPASAMGVADWLLAPTQVLATLTAGAVFHDPAGELERRRRVLRWYPDDVWRYALAAGWLRYAEEEAFVGRAGSRGDDLGSRLVAGRLVRELVRLTFLVERRWAPYAKWLGTGFAGLAAGPDLGPVLAAVTAARDWRGRQDAVCAAAEFVAAATNDLGLGPAVEPVRRRYYDRDLWVLGADRFTVALTSAITDPGLRALLARLGTRHGSSVPRLPGTVDQAVDSVHVLTDPLRCRAAAPLLGLRPFPPR